MRTNVVHTDDQSSAGAHTRWATHANDDDADADRNVGGGDTLTILL